MNESEFGPDIDLDTEEVYLSDGTRLTEARAREIADEITREDAEVRPTSVTFPRRGRPSLTKAGEHSPQLTFRMPHQLHREAVDLAERQGRPVSAVAREALERYVADEGESSAR